MIVALFISLGYVLTGLACWAMDLPLWQTAVLMVINCIASALLVVVTYNVVTRKGP